MNPRGAQGIEPLQRSPAELKTRCAEGVVHGLDILQADAITKPGTQCLDGGLLGGEPLGDPGRKARRIRQRTVRQLHITQHPAEEFISVSAMTLRNPRNLDKIGTDTHDHVMTPKIIQ